MEHGLENILDAVHKWKEQKLKIGKIKESPILGYLKNTSNSYDPFGPWLDN